MWCTNGCGVCRCRCGKYQTHPWCNPCYTLFNQDLKLLHMSLKWPWPQSWTTLNLVWTPWTSFECPQTSSNTTQMSLIHLTCVHRSLAWSLAAYFKLWPDVDCSSDWWWPPWMLFWACFWVHLCPHGAHSILECHTLLIYIVSPLQQVP
jgi:hypothetical protein